MFESGGVSSRTGRSVRHTDVPAPVYCMIPSRKEQKCSFSICDPFLVTLNSPKPGKVGVFFLLVLFIRGKAEMPAYTGKFPPVPRICHTGHTDIEELLQ